MEMMRAAGRGGTAQAGQSVAKGRTPQPSPFSAPCGKHRQPENHSERAKGPREACLWVGDGEALK